MCSLDHDTGLCYPHQAEWARYGVRECITREGETVFTKRNGALDSTAGPAPPVKLHLLKDRLQRAGPDAFLESLLMVERLGRCQPDAYPCLLS